MKNVLITGISGFVGGFLAERLAAQPDITIIGTYLSETNFDHLSSIQNTLQLVEVDLLERGEIADLIRTVRPDTIYHLAGLSSPAESFKHPSQTINNNIAAEINLLESVRENNLLDTKVLIISSSEVYGMISPEDLPVDEETIFRPISPYGVSKIAQDYLGLQYHLAYKLNILRVRPFNHIGPRQSPHFVTSSFAKQIAEIERGKKDAVFKVGNLHAKRDFTDVRDIVRAYELIVAKGATGDVYNVGSGVSYSISDILNSLLGLAKVTITFEVDQALLRPGDIPEVICNNRKIADLGWKPQIPLQKSLQDTLDYWRNIL